MDLTPAQVRFTFVPGPTADNPPPSERGPVHPGPVVVRVPASTQQQVVLTGFLVEFDPNRALPNAGDHRFGQLEVRLSAARVDATSVSVRASIGLRDWSHDWDDPFDGHINFVVITE